MIQLRTLGHVELVGPDGAPLASALAQPKRLALLAHLAIAAPGGFVRRDALLAMFWPDSDEERARGAFRQAVRYLRRSLGSAAVANRGADEVGIPGDVLWCDAAAFRAAAAAGRHEEALALYRGDLLEGLVISDAPAFMDWLDRERSAMRQSAVAAARELSAAAERGGDLTAATRWARHALGMAPCDEAAAQRLITLLDRRGNRAAAVATYDAFADRLARELDLDPSPETSALVAGIRQRGGDGTAPSIAPPTHEIVLSLGDELPRPPAPRTEAPPSPPAAIPRWRRGAMLASGALVVLMGLAWAWPRSPEGAALQPVLVVPLENQTGSARLDPLGSMAADWITHGLAATGAFEVVPATALLAARRHVASGEGGAPPLAALVRETGARAVVAGAFYRQGDSLIFHASVTRARDGRVLAAVAPVAASAALPVEGVDRLRQRVLAAVAPLQAAPSHARAAAAPPTFEAYRSYLAGMEAFVGNDPAGALRHFERAASTDGTYAMPLLAAAIMHMNLGSLHAADSIALRVEALRDGLGPLEDATLDMLRAWLRGDDAAAYEAVVRQARIAPNTIGHYQVAEQARRLNRPREAIRVLRELQPERGELRGWRAYWRELAGAHHMLGEHRRELAAARRARALHPDSPMIVRLEVRALAALGRERDIEAPLAALLAASASSSEITTIPGDMMIAAANDLRAFGRPEAAARYASRAVAWFAASREAAPEDRRLEHGLARALLAAGRLDEAHAAYAALLAQPAPPLAVLGQAGILAAMRGATAEAVQLSEELAAADAPYRHHEVLYWQAAIAAQLGDRQRGADLLTRAFGRGLQHGPWTRSDPFLAPLLGFPAFEELVRPKG
jgi:DNA-binding SARP family transcriptional activator/TolB-like protein